MKWHKKQRIFDPENNNSNWISHYATLPVADLIDPSCLRIYFSTRDALGRSLATFIEVNPEQPNKVTYVHSKPILSLGPAGTFDDNGIMPCWIITHEGRKYLYYIGWNPQITVSYRLSIGFAISNDGINFDKISQGPILDRDLEEPFFNTAPCVVQENGKFLMWYASGTGWRFINDHPEPLYNIKLAESLDGIHWQRLGLTCIDGDTRDEAIARPCVYFENNQYHMIYSYRQSLDYRTDPATSYRLGYATSPDGQNWTRKDTEVGIERSIEGWDSEMMEYATTYWFKGRRYLIYNGNGFGQSGFGYAIQQKDD